MATKSPSPPDPALENLQNPGTEASQPTSQDQQNAVADATKSTSVFVNSEPIREEQVQNAVKFLSHPKVRGSPIMYRRSFLEKKGLTKDEIDEAFRHVPDPPPSAQNTAEGQLKTSSSSQPQTTIQTVQPNAAVPAKAVAPLATSTWPRFHWSHAIFGVGFLAASGCGTALLIKNVFIPRFKSWIRKVALEEENDIALKKDSKPSLVEEAAFAAKAAAAAAADVAKASQEMLNSRSEERTYFMELMNMLNLQVQEMKSMSTAIQKLEGGINTTGRTSLGDHDDHYISRASSQKPYVNGNVDYDSHTVRSVSPPAPVAPHPKSYMEIMDMVQRGEKPPNIREINDSPPNPNQQPSNPRVAPRAKPWEVNLAQQNSNQVMQSSEGINFKVPDNGLMYQSNGDKSVPWLQSKNVRISEIEDENELKAAPYVARANEHPIRPRWVPPQPPPVAMAEAAEAIRRPKPSGPTESSGPLAGDQPVEASSGVTGELQRITKVSESGGANEDINGGSSLLQSNEIQEAENESIEQSG